MKLQDLLALDKTSTNPIQKLVTHYWQSQSLKSILSSYPQDSAAYLIGTGLDNTTPLMQELETLLASENFNPTTLAPQDITVANNILETFDRDTSIILEVMLEGAWVQAQETNGMAVEFVKEFLQIHTKEAFFYALKRENTDNIKKILASEKSLDVILDYLQEALAREHLTGIAVLATKIIDDFPAFKQVHKGIDWSSIARLTSVTETLKTSTYSTLPKLISHALQQPEIRKELDNLGKTIGYIRSDPFYTQTALILQHLTALVNFTSDIETLYRLKNYLEAADIDSLDYQMTNHTEDTNALAPFRNPFNRQTNQEQDFESIGRIHNLMAAADIGEILGQLSPQVQEYFGLEVVGEIKKLRNIIFHPERDSNWGKLEEMINKGESPYTKTFFIDVLKNYEIAAEVYHFLAGRNYQREEVPGFSIGRLFEKEAVSFGVVSEVVLAQKVLDRIPEDCGELYDYYIDGKFLPDKVLWNYIKSVVKSPPNITSLGGQMTPEAISKKVEFYLKEKIEHIKSCSFDKVSQKDVDFLDQFFKDNPSAFKALEKDYLTLKYHVLLQGKITSKVELENILKTLQNSSYPDAQQELESHMAKKWSVLGNNVDVAKIEEWKHLEKILLMNRLLNHENKIKKLADKLEENKDKYALALSKTQRSKKEEGIITNNLRLETEHSKAQQEKAAIMDEMLRVDDVYLQGQFLQPDALLHHIRDVLNASSSIMNLANQNITQKVEVYLKQKLQHIESCNFGKVNKKDLDFLEQFFKDNPSAFKALEKDYLTLKYHVLLQGKITSQEELAEIVEFLQNSNYLDTQQGKNGTLEDYKAKKLVEIRQSDDLAKVEEWKHLEKMLLIKRLLKTNSEIKKLENDLQKNKDKYESALSQTTKTPEVEKILVDYPKVEGIRAKTQQEQTSIINSILSIDNIAEQVSNLWIFAYANSTILPRLLFSLEKIHHYHESCKNPSSTAVSTNSVNSSYSALEFFTMLAGSFARWYLDYNNSALLKDLSNRIGVTIDKENLSLSQVLQKMQEFRGEIAHANTPQAGHTFQFKPFLYHKYDHHATACRQPLLDILKTTIPKESNNIFTELKNTFLVDTNLSQDIFVGTLVKVVKIFPDLMVSFLQDDSIKVFFTEQDKYTMIKAAVESLDSRVSEKSTGRADSGPTLLKLFKQLADDKSNDVWHMVVERLFNSTNFSKTVKIEDFWATIKQNKVDIVDNFLTKIPGFLTQVNEQGWSAIHLCAVHGNAQMMETLIKHGANIELKTQDSNIPIEIAAKCSNIECLKILLKHNIDLASNRGEIFDFKPIMHILAPNQTHLYSAYKPEDLKLSLENDHLVILAGDQKVYDFDA